MRLAICDDEPVYIEKIKAALKECDELPDDIELFEYSSGALLVETHEKNPHDIIFLDIEMPEMTGLEAGQNIRETDKNVIIVFLTSYREYVFESFRIEPFDYILKPINKEKMNDVMNRAILKLKEQNHVVQIEWKGKLDTLKVCDIVYLSSELRYVRIHTTNKEFTCIGKLDDYEDRLTNYGFLRCHQSYLINMKFIESIKNKVITTTEGKEIGISARKKQEFLDAYNDYIAKYRV